MKMSKKRAMLIILDGFGEGKKESTNAIYAANTPFIDSLKENHSWSLLEPGGETVGVLPGQTGGSDVGHNTIGAGRVIRQPIKIIYDSIQDKSFFGNKDLVSAINHAKKNNSNLHLLGIGADSFIHSHTQFIYALLDLCEKENFSGDKVFLHLAADGRDNPMDSSLGFFTEIENKCKEKRIGKIASLFGRFYLDRGENWDRTEKLYNLLTDKNQKFISDWKSYFKENYRKNISDELLDPIAIGNEDGILPRIKNNDAVINFNYRADRERQITEVLTEGNFKEFDRNVDIPDLVQESKITKELDSRIRGNGNNGLNNLYYVGFIQYSPKLKNAHYAFEEEQANICLSEIIDQAGINQMHVAGREKIIFVTYNLNRCENLNLETESDATAPQTKEVRTFDLNPEMSAPNLTKILLDELERDKQDVYVVNYENCDQVGHTGNLKAAITAVEAVDKSLSQVIPKALEKGFEIIITADHGNADVMVDENGNPHTAHSHNKVPCIFVSNKRKVKIKDGVLSDIAPTFLNILGIDAHEEMTGKCLIDN